MFPPFIDSFGNQFSAVVINAFGTILAGVFNSLFSAFTTSFITPLWKAIAAALGLPV